MDAHGIDSLDELYRHFLVRMNDIVKRHGKKTIVWEGFSKIGKTCIPRDVTVMVYECKYNVPQDLLADGYHIINTAWQPLYISGVLSRMWSPECIYRWNYYRWENWWEQSKAYKNPITVEPTPQVLGAQMCAWELVQEKELPLLRDRLAAMSERAWNPDATSSFADFSRRFQVTDAGLETLLCKP
jgi:hexosaminidase